MNRRGFMTLWLLIVMGALVSVASLLLFDVTQGAVRAVSMRNGLSAQYAAESGAVWALEYIKENGFPEEDETLTVTMDGDTAFRVAFRIDADKGQVVNVRGEDIQSGALRYVQMIVITDENGVMAESVTNLRERW